MPATAQGLREPRRAKDLYLHGVVARTYGQVSPPALNRNLKEATTLRPHFFESYILYE